MDTFCQVKGYCPLLDRIIAYNLLPVVNNYLLSEIFNALAENKWMHENNAAKIIAFIRKVTFTDTERAVYALSPDPEDNYLFDLAIQHHCVFILTDGAFFRQKLLFQRNVTFDHRLSYHKYPSRKFR
jgi:predicted nucleic acid-binding protein